MNILGIGPFEFLLIFLVAFIFLGPEKLSKFSKDLGKYIRRFSNQKDELSDLLDSEINESRKKDIKDDESRK